MKRKVNLVGKNTLTVSLPSKWAEKHGIKKGDEIELKEEGAALVFSSNSLFERKEININLTKESDRYIRSYLGRLYRKGYSQINISFDHPDVMSHIKNAVHGLMGADIIDTEPKACVIRIFPLDSPIDYDRQMIKMLITMKYMLDVIEKELDRDKFSSEATLEELRATNWKIKDFILRVATMEGVSHETFSNFCHLTFCYEKACSKLMGFYKRYLMHQKKIEGKPVIFSCMKKLNYFIDEIIQKIGQKRPFSIDDEKQLRHQILEFNVKLLKELHHDKKVNHSFLSMIYFISEMIDSTVSYIMIFKSQYDKIELF